MLNLIFSILIMNIIANPEAGSTGYIFLRINPSAQSAAMANTAIGFESNQSISSLNYLCNPATIINNTNFSIGYIDYVAGISLGTIGYALAKPFPFLKSGGIAVTYLNSGQIKRTDETGAELGAFSVSYLNLNTVASMSFLAEKLIVGSGFKLIYGSIDSFMSLATALDLGVRYKPTFPKLTIGAVIKNLGISIKPFDEIRDPLPLDIGLGACYFATDNITLALDLHKPIDNSVLFNFGVEAWLNNNLVFRIGYNSSGKYYKTGGFANLISGFASGIGIKYSKYQLDYSATPMGDLGLLHHLNISLIL